MSSAWVKRAKVARKLSRSSIVQQEGGYPLYAAESDVLVEFSNKVLEFRNRSHVDRRSIAVGADGDAFFYDATASLSRINNPDFAETSSLTWMHNKMWYELARPHDASGEKKYKVLSMAMLPVSDYISELANPAVDTWFVNNLDLYFLERFYINNMYDGSHGDLVYTAFDTSDLTSPEMIAEFDFVRIPSKLVLWQDFGLLDKYMDCTKVGGTFLLNFAGSYGDLYVNDNVEFNSIYYDMARHIAARSDFLTFHVPYDQGMIVCRRVSA